MEKFKLPTASDFRRLRKAKGMTQRELVELAGVHQTLICRIEADDINTRLNTARRILYFLQENGL